MLLNPLEPNMGFSVCICLTGLGVLASAAYVACMCYCIGRCLMKNRNMNGRTAANNNGPNYQDPPVKRHNTLKGKILRAFKKNTESRRKAKHNVKDATLELGQLSISCPICMEDFAGVPDEIFLGLLKKCGHFFHFDCVWEWLETKGNCPLCRTGIEFNENDIRGVSLKYVLENFDTHVQDSATKHDIINEKENQCSQNSTEAYPCPPVVSQGTLNGETIGPPAQRPNLATSQISENEAAESPALSSTREARDPHVVNAETAGMSSQLTAGVESRLQDQVCRNNKTAIDFNTGNSTSRGVDNIGYEDLENVTDNFHGQNAKSEMTSRDEEVSTCGEPT